MEPDEACLVERQWPGRFEAVTTEISFDEKKQIKTHTNWFDEAKRGDIAYHKSYLEHLRSPLFKDMLVFRDVKVERFMNSFARIPLVGRGINHLELLANSTRKKTCFVCTNKKCMKHYVTAVANRTHCGTGCPNCIKVSMFHDATKAFLDDYKPGLVEDSGRDLSFDFIIGKDLLLEIDGGYHFKPSGRQDGAAKFKSQQRYDGMKINIAKTIDST
uniref:DUF559 domain-containing protein n=1 Tax=Rhabditophanes sp. KR3021 TaxID=114890 RepID=A0AC35UBV8_9BILA